jgi:hypothetical protein
MEITTDDLSNLNAVLYVWRAEEEALEVLAEKNIEGTTSLTITEDDFADDGGSWWDALWGWFDADDDYFYLKVSTTPSTWDYDVCTSGLYDLTIGS